MATTYNRRINLYINEREVRNEIACMRRMKDSGSFPPMDITSLPGNIDINHLLNLFNGIYDYKEYRSGEKACEASRHPIITHLGNSSSPIKKEKAIHPMGAGENHCHLPRKAI